ncbi:hypothetical protein AABB24_022863 [Solanum stoloniferum]|uniref:Disease resistance protein winged helix domain-containing protein n=1 Tax=Solanum stoloniferum TaxID=62892 RepID=A0ABD2T230_9SOLN
MMPLSLYDSWKLLHKKLFGVEQNCPAELEEIGRAIVGKCEGLPLAILVVAGHLSKVPMTKETWAIVAKNVNRVVASDPEGRIALLAMGYHYLPIHLKPCFLHIGTIPRGNEIDAWTLIRLWVAEGFLKNDKLRSPEEVAEECLEDLVSRNLIMVPRKKVDGRIKSCSMHGLLRDFSVREAEKEKLLNVITNNEVPNFSAANELSPPNFSLHTSISLENFMKSSQVVRSLYLFKEPTGKTSKFKSLRVLATPKSSFIFRHHMILDSAILRYLEVTGDNDFMEFLG